MEEYCLATVSVSNALDSVPDQKQYKVPIMGRVERGFTVVNDCRNPLTKCEISSSPSSEASEGRRNLIPLLEQTRISRRRRHR